MQNTLAFHATQRLRPQYASVADAALIVLGTLVLAAMAQISIYLPFSPVPITGQTFAVLLIGMLYGSRRGAATVLLYLAEGAAGLPVFAGARAGIPVLLGPTGGYLAGFVVAAYVVGFLAEQGSGQRLLNTLGTFALGSAVIYLFGVIWLSTLLGLREAVAAGVMPFLIGDAFKAVLAALLLPTVWKLIRPAE